MNLKDKKKKDFLTDILELTKQYGFLMDDVYEVLSVRPKTEQEVLFDQATELYKKGVVFVPVGKKKIKTSSGEVELLFDRIWCWYNLKMYKVYEPTTKQWAEIKEDVN